MSLKNTMRRAAALVFLFAVVLAAAPFAAAQTPQPAATPPPTATPGPTPDPARLQRTENFLVLGADVRPGPWMMHTDSIMLVAIDHETQQVGVLSVPRDLWVDVPGWGMDRINSAYFLGDYTKYKGGSPALAKAVAEKTLGVPIQHVVLIKMDGLSQLVDALGGVTVKLDCPLYEQTPDPKNPNKVVNWIAARGRGDAERRAGPEVRHLPLPDLRLRAGAAAAAADLGHPQQGREPRHRARRSRSCGRRSVARSRPI